MPKTLDKFCIYIIFVSSNANDIMKTQKIKIEVIKFQNGSILLSKCYNRYWVMWPDSSVHEYTENEMKECYNYKD